MALKRQKTKRVTLADVAAKAGVSVATASVAVTGRPSGNCRVSPAVAEKIRAVAKELHYRPNLQARNLSTQRTHTVAMLIKRASWHNAMYYVGAAQKVLRSFGYAESFMLHENVVQEERTHLELCIQRGVEGILAIPLIDPSGAANVDLYNRLYTEESISVVQLGLALPGCSAPSVTANVSAGIAKTITLLHAMGHRHIAHSTVPGYDSTAELNPAQYAHKVYLGYREGMAKVGLPEQVFVAPPAKADMLEHYDTAFSLAKQIAKAEPRPTVVITVSTYAATGLMAGFSDLGVRVPDDISLLACGDLPFARMMRPALATLSSPYEKIGTLGAEMLLKMIDGGTVSSAELLPAVNLCDSVRELK